MKVLITIGEYTYPNPYVRTLASGMRELGLDVVCSDTNFWDKWDIYDVIHIQWPQILVKKDMKSIEPLRDHFELLKRSGKKIVVTCHNIEPHYSKNPIIDEAYLVSYQYADVIVHLGQYSYKLFCQKYNQANNIIIRHHIYDRLYANMVLPSREEAIKKLKLDPNYRYIICMGAFRDDEERELLKIACNSVIGKRIKFLAPGFARYDLSWKHPLCSFRSYLKFKYLIHRHPDIICKGKYIPDDMMLYYYAASDIALIHRKKILNSGNLPFALMMGKVVVGPNTGNVGQWLYEIDNPSFDVSNLTSIKTAIECALKNEQSGIGLKNKNYAYDNLSSVKIASQFINLYLGLYNE